MSSLQPHRQETEAQQGRQDQGQARQDQLQGRVQQDQVQRDQRDRVRDLLQQPDLQDLGLRHMLRRADQQQKGNFMEESKQEQGRPLKPALMLASLKVG